MERKSPTCYGCINQALTKFGRPFMQDDWILDVLADLRAFAAANQLPRTAEQLDDAALVALAEMSAQREGIGRAHGKTAASGTDMGRVGTG